MSTELSIKAEDVQNAIQSNPAVDWALKEQALLRQIKELQEELSKYKTETTIQEEKKDAKG